ncbi:MAG TPA: hypothetical protein VMW24_25015 [Sedimentisphaerales bacterium]|nr:hypothetical protein [Sedimentisphaerales bacterium]
MPRLAAKKDANHDEIAEVFRKLGWQWTDTYQLGMGFPDGVISRPGMNILIEVKSEKGTLTPEEKRFQKRFVGPLYYVRSVEEAQVVDALQKCRESRRGK